MAQRHMDRLSAVDAGFLHQESATTHMHIGSVAIFAGAPPSQAEFLDHIRRRLSLVPRYRQHIVAAPVGLGRQRWVDDPSFNLDYHVRRTALPAPHDLQRLRELAARIFSIALDRDKPLWEMWLVERVADERFALISKVHHALVDGIAGVDLLSLLFDTTPTPRPAPADDWVPHPDPTAAELVADAARGTVAGLAALPGRVIGAVRSPGHAVEELAQPLGGLTAITRTLLFEPAPPSPLNVPIGSHRRVALVPARLDDFRTVKAAFGGTVNDVVLTVVGGALRRLYEFRGEETGVTLRVQIPVSTRSSRERGGVLGNRVTQMIAPLDLGIADPVQRLLVVSAAMAGVKESRQAVGAATIASMQDFAPPTILAEASRLNFNNRMFNLLVTNVPGPQTPVYALGRELESIFPIAFLAGDRALAVAIMSYNGGMNFGLLGDYDELPDIDVIAAGLDDALGELVRLARKERPAVRGRGAGRAGARRNGAPAQARRAGGASKS